MKYLNRRAVKHADLNPAAKLFGGTLLSWIDEEAGIYASCQLETKRLVTKYMSEINFISSAQLGDIVEIGIETVEIGRTSICLACEVRNKESKQGIIRVEKIVMVAVDAQGKPRAHGWANTSLTRN